MSTTIEPDMSEEERVRRLRITFEQLEKFEASIAHMKESPRPEGVHPDIRIVEIEAQVSVAVDLREEATKLAHGAYICTRLSPWKDGTKGRGCHPAAEDDGGCSTGCCDDYKCPYCGVHWRIEHGD